MVYSLRIPGKLYLAGEYAVVTPGYAGILLTVSRYLTLDIWETSPDQASVRSQTYGNQAYAWERLDGIFSFKDWSHPFHLVETVIQTVEAYIESLSLPLKSYGIQIKSQLDYQGKKIGLGSSGAVTIAVIRGLSLLYDLHLKDIDIFKLAAIAHIQLKSKGSFGDLAACTYTGVIRYQSLDREWLQEQISNHSIKDLLAMDWPSLGLDRLSLPHDLRLLIGWTGQPASTEKLVQAVYPQKITRTPLDFQSFLDQSQECVDGLVESLSQADSQASLAWIQKNRTLLKAMGQSRGKVIETKALTYLCDIVAKYGGQAKSSGAGGGDCGIGLITRESPIEAIYREWMDAGILPLRLDIVENGACYD
ncbi:mevalonate kinase [Alloiococcus otitis]|uniref:phosphomevalonate kinase n=1 Tax=Alloiococcus otitis ATCC 51267 TaxID=883081 RepID=K9E7S2_9LACT|nr:phosphomevalonate kinase [Alloiococcus otitis]EKU93259.1 phosphomevalonate kinase [Alloiococcus otitis ATCC 51267]SUU80597.1 mevalonate kinase [Alloiococcus otitis]